MAPKAKAKADAAPLDRAGELRQHAFTVGVSQTSSNVFFVASDTAWAFFPGQHDDTAGQHGSPMLRHKQHQLTSSGSLAGVVMRLRLALREAPLTPAVLEGPGRPLHLPGAVGRAHPNWGPRHRRRRRRVPAPAAVTRCRARVWLRGGGVECVRWGG
jgi:hypothetical protein